MGRIATRVSCALAGLSCSMAAVGCADGGVSACTDFAVGSLSDESQVPAEIETALGVTLRFESVDDNALDMTFVCSSNGEELESGVVDGNGTGFEVEVDDEPFRVAFAWAPGDDVEFSVAVTRL